jgi:hypothetical protein
VGRHNRRYQVKGRDDFVKRISQRLGDDRRAAERQPDPAADAGAIIATSTQRHQDHG